MLCPHCHHQLEPDDAWCRLCGVALKDANAPLELVLADGTRVPVLADLTIGRSPEADIVLTDPSVSRVHARVSAGGMLEDAGTTNGTWADGVRVRAPTPLADGSAIRLGDAELHVERSRAAAQAGRTVVVPPASHTLASPTLAGSSIHPRLRSGYALKRLAASEGPKRWVLKDLRSGGFLRLSDSDARLLEQLDGGHALLDLVAGSERSFGAAGPPRLARLLAELGERGFLSGVAGALPVQPRRTRLQRLFTPRTKAFPRAADAVGKLYGRGGWLIFTRPARIALAALICAGLAAFAYLVAGRYGTPFVVAQKIGLGAIVYLLGRFVVVAVHETAHALTLSSFGRPVTSAGLKLVGVFPYAFVDTSEAWFEPRRRRIAVSAAGPVADLVAAAVFALVCLLAAPGATRDVLFQLAFGAYVGACFNLNPFLQRDGYHVLVDVLGEPGLRRRAREQLMRRLGGRKDPSDSPVLARYAALGLAWSSVAALFATAMSLRYVTTMRALAPDPVVYCVLALLWAGFFLPVIVVAGRPALERLLAARGR